MHRFSHFTDADDVAHCHPAHFEDEGANRRLVAGVPDSDPAVFAALAHCLRPPYFLLYVLHSPRGVGDAGRYQSPAITAAELDDFVARFEPYLRGDGRFDLWVHSPADGATVVWDRHDLIFAYGPIVAYTEVLRARGFVPGAVAVPVPHSHHYHAELDGFARDVLAAFDWKRTPLAPQVEQ